MAGCGDEPQARNGGNIPKTFDKKSWWDDSYYLWLYQNARSWLEVGQVGCIFWMVLQILLKRTYRIVYCGSGFMAHPLPSSLGRVVRTVCQLLWGRGFLNEKADSFSLSQWGWRAFRTNTHCVSGRTQQDTTAPGFALFYCFLVSVAPTVTPVLVAFFLFK